MEMLKLKEKYKKINKECGCGCHYDDNGELKTNPDHHWCGNCGEKHIKDNRHPKYTTNS